MYIMTMIIITMLYIVHYTRCFDITMTFQRDKGVRRD